MTKPVADARSLLARSMKEEGKGGLREEVENLAGLCGYVVRHLRDSRKQNTVGLPDLLLIHPKKGRLIWAELKAEKRSTSLDQDLFMQALTDCRQEVYLWRPTDFLDGTVLRVLKGETP